MKNNSLPVLELCQGGCCSERGAPVLARELSEQQAGDPDHLRQNGILWRVNGGATAVRVRTSKCLECGGQGGHNNPKAALQPASEQGSRVIIGYTSLQELEQHVVSGLGTESQS